MRASFIVLTHSHCCDLSIRSRSIIFARRSKDFSTRHRQIAPGVVLRNELAPRRQECPKKKKRKERKMTRTFGKYSIEISDRRALYVAIGKDTGITPGEFPLVFYRGALRETLTRLSRSVRMKSDWRSAGNESSESLKRNACAFRARVLARRQS